MEPVVPKVPGMNHVTHDGKAYAAQNDEQGNEAVDHRIMDIAHKALIIAKKVEASIAEGGNGMPIPIIDALEAKLLIKTQGQAVPRTPSTTAVYLATRRLMRTTPLISFWLSEAWISMRS